VSASPKVETGDTPTVIRARLTALRRERLPDVVAIACSAGPERVVATTMARSSMRHRAVFKFAAPILAVAILGLCSLPRTDAFTVPSLPGLSSFTGSAAPVNTVGSAKLQTLADQRIRLQARVNVASPRLRLRRRRSCCCLKIVFFCLGQKTVKGDVKKNFLCLRFFFLFE
jgi:hypothetical protein